MRSLTKRKSWVLAGATIGAIIFISYYHDSSNERWARPNTFPDAGSKPSTSVFTQITQKAVAVPTSTAHPASPWSGLKQNHPVQSTIILPPGKPGYVPPKIQHEFTKQDIADITDSQQERRVAVKEAFEHAWSGYRQHAWLKDEVSPISGNSRNSLGGLAATLIDSLDSLWILGMREEFASAVKAVEGIDFTKSEEETVSLFEYTIRYLGGLLGAYEISERKYSKLLDKAVEIGDMLYAAFDTSNRMPQTHFEWTKALEGNELQAGESTMVAELGSLSLEFTTLSRLTKNDKYYDAIQRVADQFQKAQNTTKLPGMWPVFANARTLSFSGHTTFTLGAMSDSLYEYLPKQHLLMHGAMRQYSDMYRDTIRPIKTNLLFRPLVHDDADILFSGTYHIRDGKGTLEPMVQHLGCFAGGMLALGARILQLEEDLEIARKLTDGCIWAYNKTQSGVMPEVFHIASCTDDSCRWDENHWHSAIKTYLEDTVDDSHLLNDRIKSTISDSRLVEGFTKIDSSKYILRPEAIESVYYLYRITGDRLYLDKAWDMFSAIRKITHTDIANAAVKDVTLESPEQTDRMESFWLAETLKYFFLIFSDPSVVSLDEFVLNTEAHPFKIPGT